MLISEAQQLQLVARVIIRKREQFLTLGAHAQEGYGTNGASKTLTLLGASVPSIHRESTDSDIVAF